MNKMKKISKFIFLFTFVFQPVKLPAQNINPYIDSLVEVLVRERRNWNEASRLLIETGEPAVDPLLKILSDKSIEEWPRRKAAFTLAEIPSQKIVIGCIRIFQDTSENLNLRIDVCRAMKGKNISSYEKVFLKAVKHENPFMRLVAMRQIWNIGSGEAVKIAFQATRDEYNMVRRGGYEYLSQFNGDSVNQAFLQGLFDNDWYVREYIFSEIIIRGESLAGALEKIIENPDSGESVRWSSLSILRKIISYRKVEFFFRMQGDPSWMIRNEATLALYDRKGLYTWEEAAARLESLDTPQKYSIFWLIGKLGQEESVHWLATQLNHPDYGWMAAVALGLSQSDQVYSVLNERLNDPDIRMKRASLWALSRIRPPDGTPFIRFLNDKDPELVRLALYGLNRPGIEKTR